MSGLPIKILSMTAQHLPSVTEIESQTQLSPWSRKEFERSLSGVRKSWVALRDNIVVGYAVFSVIASEAELLTISVHPEYQGQGIASDFLASLMLPPFLEPSVERVFLEVRASNLVAQSLYEKLGFHQIGVRENYYPAKSHREDAFIFARENAVELA
ncbi:ribosomal protein S18-alanine N-acetyltransferase [Marinibactrum halimedae]|uniref:Ribosomal-protein-alanine acetyltransferase n=1 Tax=Marinibactrum halimedae TaxID=1444977 RepID=A0AA37T576_9GAMM|nr:ribosomal protein S18-alanine N-acetyltransferase [Marinibactrum halimedae]MCD9459928.1 ribosomal protein S18-alanine N-acetyltransferase [Marinibactrum halimedae]GLS25217.1 ribosomal-protein-alanine acetyltransferase [Marinibactrum halimedae]